MNRCIKPAQGQRLSLLLAGLAEINAANDCDIYGLSIDSRKVVKGDLFIAYRGEQTDGMRYIQDAVSAGAVAVAYEGDLHRVTDSPLPMVRVNSLQESVGLIASRFYEHPSQKLFVVGVTGTNGKTSCCHFLSQALQLNGQQCGVMGTLGYGIPGALQSATHTTPNPVMVQSHIKAMGDAGAESVVMEVSSHALAQSRVAAVAFDVAIFTNLTRDHLDYHGSFDAYGAAKQKLFAMPGLNHAVINRDDPFGAQLLTSLPLSVKGVAYGLLDELKEADMLLADQSLGVYGKVMRLDGAGIEIHIKSAWGSGVLRNAHLLGTFNASNLLAALATLLIMALPLKKALTLLAQVSNAAGRMERLGGEAGKPLVVIDYAHTPDALKNILQALREHCSGRLWCVFGCGGERDRGKRPQMGAIAAQYADEIIITDDNPRFEDAEVIAAEIVAGAIQCESIEVIHDRGVAIGTALKRAAANDVVVVAGKGHESFQIVAGQCLPFSDRECVQAILREVV